MYVVAAIVIIAAVVIYFRNAKNDSGNGETLIATDAQATQTAVQTEAVQTGTVQTDAALTDTPATATPTKTNAVKTDVPATATPDSGTASIDENGSYTSKEDVALYIHTYGKLPGNFITKNEAKALGWSGNGNDLLEKYAPGKSIGGDYFGNYEGLLPKKKGRSYTECDIDTYNKVRGTKRIVFSNDGLVYYSEDHYENFELLYGEP